MADPNFFNKAGALSLKEIQQVSGGELVLMEACSDDFLIDDLASIQEAGSNQVCFLQNSKYKKYLADCKAGLIILHANDVENAPNTSNLLVCDDPYRAWGQLSVTYYPFDRRPAGQHPTAIIHPTATIADTAYIGPYVVIEANAQIGDHTQIHAHSVVGASVSMGQYCEIHPLVTLSHCQLGHQVIVHTGAKIGQDGFGFAMGPKGHQYVRQLGRVLIGNDVNIGANTTVDRGAGPDTIIEDGVRIDNLVQIAHNVHLGAGTVIAAQAGIAGSTVLGRGVVLGGQTAVAGHLHLHDRAMLTAKSGTDKDIPVGEVWASSIPSLPVKQHWRRVAMLQKLLKKPSV